MLMKGKQLRVNIAFLEQGVGGHPKKNMTNFSQVDI